MLLTVLTVYKGSAQQPGDLGVRVLRGVAGGVAEEARIRGFPFPPLDGVDFIGFGSDLSIVPKIANRLPVTIVRFGSVSAFQYRISSTAALERKAASQTTGYTLH